MIRIPRVLLLVLTAVAAGCSGPPAAPEVPTPAPWSEAQLAGTWVWRIAYDESVPETVVDDLGRRWLGSGDETSWAPPGTVEASRWYAEDAAAIAAIGATYAVAMCALGSAEGTFGAEVPEGYFIAEEACLSIGETERAARAQAQITGTVELMPGTGLIPVVERAVEAQGQTLHYRFLRPAQFQRVARGLASMVRVEPDDLATTAGRSLWGGGLNDVTAILSTAPVGTDRAAYIEREAEEHIEQWKRSLAAAGVEPTEQALLIGWVRRAVYRDLGLRELTARPDVAIGLLEEAVGSASRPGPGPGVDPWLLASLAQARLGEGEPGLAAEILRGIAGAQGWQFAGPVADACARVAVLPSSTSSGVKR